MTRELTGDLETKTVLGIAETRRKELREMSSGEQGHICQIG